MSRPARIAILDADGVFLAERPYWNAALAASFDLAGLSPSAAGRWDALADYAFGPIGLQRVTKRRGCNSNWDLAAVLSRALAREAWRETIRALLEADREFEAMQTLAGAADASWRPADRTDPGGDPLLGFGIDRDGEPFRGVTERFQARLHGEGDPPWRFERWQLRDPGRESAEALARLRERGFELRVCTGRHRAEIVGPIRELGLAGLLDERALTSADEVDLAQAESGRRALGKPHWFAPACALVGYDRALRLLVDEGLMPDGPVASSAVYLGDAWADFKAVEGCRDRGLPLEYVHVRSGVTTVEQERHIERAHGTLQVVDSLTELVGTTPTVAR